MVYIFRYIFFAISVVYFHQGFAQKESLNTIELQFSEIETYIGSGKYKESLFLLGEIESLNNEILHLNDVQKVNLVYLKALVSIKSGNSNLLSRQDSSTLYFSSVSIEIPVLLQAKILNLNGLYFTVYPARNLDSSIYYFQSAIEKLKEESDTAALLFRASLLENIGKAYYYKGELLNAIPKIEKAFILRERVSDSTDVELAKSYASYAVILSQTGEIAKSEEFNEKALHIYEKNRQSENHNVVSIYINMANAYLRKGELTTARIFYDKALHLNLKYEPLNSVLSTHINCQIAQIFLREGKYSKGIEEMDRIFSSVKKSGDFGNSDIARMYVDFAIELYEINKLPEAEEVLSQALEMFSSDPQVYLPDYVVGISYYVRILIDQKRWNEAEKFNRIHHEVSVKVYGEEHWGNCYYHYFEGKIFLAGNKFSEARKKMSECIAFLEDDNLMSVVQSNDPLTLADAYTTISRSYLMQYELIPNKEYLHEARNNIYKANEIILALQESKLAPEDKIRVRKYIPKVLECILLVEKSFQHPDLSLILKSMDQGKNQILKESLTEAEDMTFAGVPSEITQRWKSLKDSVSFLDRQWKNEISDEYRIQLQKNYLSAVNRLEDYKGFISREYPGIYKLKTTRSDLVIASLKEELGADRAVIQYFWGEEYVFIYYLDRGREVFKSVVKDEVLSRAVIDFKTSVSDPDTDVGLYFRSAHILYQKLILPLGDLPEALIIVPDGMLSYLPFEAFLTQEVMSAADLRKLPYLIKRHAISYNFSLELLNIMKARPGKKGRLLALAPKFNNQKFVRSNGDTMRFGNLVNTEAEVTSVSRYFSGNYYSGSNATKSTLLSNISSHNILHLATHAVSDEENHKASFLVFSEEKEEDYLLFFEDIYGMDWPLDMVVLSACETAHGLHLQGEGIAGLSRAFAFAGAKSMVISLWSANDKSAGQIMAKFYEKLSSGRRKDMALQQAKIDYLNGIFDIDKAHPYYWSNFILYGDTSPIERSEKWTFFFVALVLIMLLTVFAILMRFK